MVNEQTEIGILLALPGLLGTLALAPWVMEAFYSKQFLSAASLLPWFVVGIFGRVLSWPLGFVILARGAARWFVVTETVVVGFQLVSLLWMVPRFGLVGVAYTFAVTYLLHTIAMLVLTQRLIGFRWSPGVKRLLLVAGALILVGLFIRVTVTTLAGTFAGLIVAGAGSVLTIRGLCTRIGSDSPFCKIIRLIPGGLWISGGH